EVGELRDEIESNTINKEKVAAELGDIMFMLVDFARWYGFDAEDALRTTNNRFERSFRHMEQGLKNIGKDFRTSTSEERKNLWEEAKGDVGRSKKSRKRQEGTNKRDAPE
ncbi:MAG: hypothetical protein KAI76_08590, partial [Alphaproteobacteria bacterium]|nr:hypothetical protein [Alphaproteobacteria bacterium]